jgi:hypothetical protein
LVFVHSGTALDEVKVWELVVQLDGIFQNYLQLASTETSFSMEKLKKIIFLKSKYMPSMLYISEINLLKNFYF